MLVQKSTKRESKPRPNIVGGVPRKARGKSTDMDLSRNHLHLLFEVSLSAV